MKEKKVAEEWMEERFTPFGMSKPDESALRFRDYVRDDSRMS